MVDDASCDIPGEEAPHIFEVGIGKGSEGYFEFAAFLVPQVESVRARPLILGCEGLPIGVVPDAGWPRLQGQDGSKDREEEQALQGRYYQVPE